MWMHKQRAIYIPHSLSKLVGIHYCQMVLPNVGELQIQLEHVKTDNVQISQWQQLLKNV